jgi:hypothetical protein
LARLVLLLDLLLWLRVTLLRPLLVLPLHLLHSCYIDIFLSPALVTEATLRT